MDAFWVGLDKYGMLVAAAASLYSAAMWVIQKRRERRMKDPIVIRLVCEETAGVLYELPIRPPRGTVTRAEVLGLLGMIPSRQQRFDWKNLIDPEFMDQLAEVVARRRNVVEIAISAAEFAQLETPSPSQSTAVP